VAFWQRKQTRREEYPASDSIRVHIKGLSGDVRIDTARDGRAIVELFTTGNEQVLAQVHVRYAAEERTLVIDTKGTKLGLFMIQRDVVDVHVVLPEHSDISVDVTSGDVDGHGRLGDVRINSASGDIDFEDAVVRSLHIKSASGDVAAQAGAPTFVDLAAGDIELQVNQPCKVEARTLSGDIEVKIQRGFVTDVNAQTLAGDISSNINFDRESGEAEPVQVELILSSLAGDIEIERM
jgi:DUF4097 and DUF4098 domain-containing protein YvlB